MFGKKAFLFPVLVLLVVLLAVCTAFAEVVDDGSASDLVTVEVDLTYDYDMAREVITLVNDFRLGNETWFWNSTSTEQVWVTDLHALIYDKGLEQVAMQRAAECAVSYAHTRPNGKRCFSLYPEGGSAENIAAGYYSAAAAFSGWKEDDEDYDGQGHRRNMLSAFSTHIGVGCVKANGVYYWCQAFAYDPGPSSVKVSSPAVVEASLTQLTDAYHGLSDAKASKKSVRVDEGSSKAAPTISATVFNTFRKTPITFPNPGWVCEDGIANVANGKVYGLAGGKSRLKWSAGNQSVSVPLTVVCLVHTAEVTPGKPATCTEEGLSDGSNCSLCGEVIVTQQKIPALGHDWGEPFYEWAEDYSSVTAKRLCTRDAKHSQKETVAAAGIVTTPSTYETPGEMTYSSKSFKNAAFAAQTIVVPIPRMNDAYVAEDGNTYAVGSNGTAAWVNSGVNKSKITIPATIESEGIEIRVTSVAAKAFYKNRKIKTVKLGKNIKTIGAGAFEGCTKLKTIKGGAALTTIGDRAFKGCKALPSFTFNSKVSKIGKRAFDGCTNLKTLTFKTKKLKKAKIGKNSFRNIYSKAVVYIPAAQMKNYKTWLVNVGAMPKAAVFRQR